MEMCNACGEEEATVKHPDLGKICATCDDLMDADLEADRFEDMYEPMEMQAEIDAEPDLDFD